MKNQTSGFVQTVTGPISPDAMGPTLPHEHVLVDWEALSRPSQEVAYRPQDVLEIVIPRLKALKKQGIQTFVDCTPDFLGRDAKLLHRLSESVGLHILTNTGFYLGRSLPSETRDADVQTVADHWIQEFFQGIADTGIQPGFIKTAVSGGPLDDFETRMMKAGALTIVETGMTMATHCGSAESADGILDILETAGVDPRKWIFVHAHMEDSRQRMIDIGRRGCWVELDGLAWGGDEEHADRIFLLADAGLEDRILVSQDAGWFEVGLSDGGPYKPYTRFVEEFLPYLESRGADKSFIRKITVENPASAYTCG